LQTALLEAVSAEAGGPWRATAFEGLYAETDLQKPGRPSEVFMTTRR
jgi:hypothetical protein